MIIQPRIRGFICTTAHPVGCSKNVTDQVSYVETKPRITGARNALVVGCSTGYGLASRICAAFGCGANTLGISLEKEPTESRTASAGWYNNLAFDEQASKQGLFAKSLNGDAFSYEMKEDAIQAIRDNMGSIDLLVYSLASPVRVHPATNETFRSAIKPIGESFRSRTLRLDVVRDRCEIDDIDIEPADESEIAATVAVMGGEDWEYWIRELTQAGVLDKDFKTIAFTYLGNELTRPIYRGGTLGRAKEDLDNARDRMNESFGDTDSEALVAVLKAVVTQASTAIPVVPLYFSILFKVMKEKGLQEDCIAHIHRMFSDQIYAPSRRLDENNRIRMDNFELDDQVQAIVQKHWETIDSSTVRELADINGFRNEFLKLFGFGRDDVDYSQDIDPTTIVS